MTQIYTSSNYNQAKLTKNHFTSGESSALSGIIEDKERKRSYNPSKKNESYQNLNIAPKVKRKAFLTFEDEEPLRAAIYQAKPKAVEVLYYLVKSTDNNTLTATRTQDTILKNVKRISKRTLANYIAYWRDRGVLESEQKSHGFGQWGSNTYTWKYRLSTVCKFCVYISSTSSFKEKKNKERSINTKANTFFDENAFKKKEVSAPIVKKPPRAPDKPKEVFPMHEKWQPKEITLRNVKAITEAGQTFIETEISGFRHHSIEQGMVVDNDGWNRLFYCWVKKTIERMAKYGNKYISYSSRHNFKLYKRSNQSGGSVYQAPLPPTIPIAERPSDEDMAMLINLVSKTTGKRSAIQYRYQRQRNLSEEEKTRQAYQIFAQRCEQNPSLYQLSELELQCEIDRIKQTFERSKMYNKPKDTPVSRIKSYDLLPDTKRIGTAEEEAEFAHRLAQIIAKPKPNTKGSYEV